MKAFIFGLLALLPSISMAGGTYGPNPPLRVGTEQLLPHRGGYWDPDAPGSGYFVDVIRRNDGTVFGFVSIYTYDAEGRSNWLTMSGNLEFASETQRRADGWYAKLVSGTFQATNGQPFLGTWRYPDLGPSSYGGGEVVWKTRRTAELRVGGRVTQIRTLQADDPITEATNLLAGYWSIKTRVRSIGVPSVPFQPAAQQYHSHVVRLTPVLPSPTWTVGLGAATIPQAVFQTFWQPPANVLTFEVTCVSECLPLPPQTLPQFASPLMLVYTGARVWIDPVTQRAGWVQNAVATPGQAQTPNLTQGEVGSYMSQVYDLYVDDDTAVGRGLKLYTNANNPPYTANAYPGSEFVMTRVTPNGLQAPLGQEIKLY
jgi:hypothetical protein